MKYCTECGKELEKDAKVCSNCGKKLVVDENIPTATIVQSKTTSESVTPTKTSNGFAVAGFVISLISFILCCGSISGLGLIFSIIGAVNAKKVNGNGKGLAIAGIILGVLGIILLFIIYTLYALGITSGALKDVTESVGTSL